MATLDGTNNSTYIKTPAEKGKMDFTKTAGIDFPIIKINSYILGYAEINEFSIEIEDFLPHLSLEIETPIDTLSGVNMPKDGDLVSVFLRTTNDDLKPIRADFIIMQIAVSEVDFTKRSQRRYNHYSIQGDLYVPKMTSEVDQFAFCGTGKEAVMDFCERYKLGFAYTDPDNTDDKQIWLCYSNTPEDYIKSVVRHIWKDETSFFDCWIDQYYNLNFVNINDILGRKLEDDGTMDIGHMVTSFTSTWLDGTLMSNNDKDDKKKCPKLFTNATAIENSVWYIKSWKPYNRSSQVTLNEGTIIEAEFFLANQYLFDNNEKQDVSVLCEPAYNPDKLTSHILLRGRTGLSMESAKQSNNGDFVDIYRKTPWMGVQYVMSDSDKKSADLNNMKWSGNLHKNYYRAEAHNRINLKELDKMWVELKFEGLNLGIARGEKIPVVIFEQNGILAEKNKSGTSFQGTITDQDVMMMYSGWFMIDSVRYEYVPNEDPALSNFITVVTVTRREWNTPEYVEPIAVTDQAKKNQQMSKTEQEYIKEAEKAPELEYSETDLNNPSTAKIKELKSKGKLAEANKLSKQWEDMRDLLKRAGITNYTVTSMYRPNNSIGKTGSKSNHTVENFAMDIVPSNGDWDGLIQQLVNSPEIRKYLKARNFGIMDERDPRWNKYFVGSGKGALHIGNDSGALTCWNEWQRKYNIG